MYRTPQVRKVTLWNFTKMLGSITLCIRDIPESQEILIAFPSFFRCGHSWQTFHLMKQKSELWYDAAVARRSWGHQEVSVLMRKNCTPQGWTKVKEKQDRTCKSIWHGRWIIPARKQSRLVWFSMVKGGAWFESWSKSKSVSSRNIFLLCFHLLCAVTHVQREARDQ